MPPSDASAPGSIGKNRPWSRRYSLSCLRVMPGSMTQSRSSAWTASTRFMSRKSSEMPPRGALTWPSSEVPAPNGMTGTRSAAHSRTTCCTSSVVCGNTTASGGWFAIQVVVLACCSRTACEVTMRLPNCAASAVTTLSAAARSCGARCCVCTGAIACPRLALPVSGFAAKIAGPKLGRNVGFVPDANQNATPLGLAAGIPDLLLGAGGALRDAQTPRRQRVHHPLACGGIFRIGAAIVELLRIVGEVEQHRPEADAVDQLPLLVGDHEQPRVARRDTERRRRRHHAVVVLADGERPPLRGTLAMDQRQQRAAFEPVRLLRRIAAGNFEKCRQQIDRLDHLVASTAARLVGVRRRVIDDQRDLHRRFVEEILVAEPVVAEIVAVVGGEHDHGVVEQALLFH